MKHDRQQLRDTFIKKARAVHGDKYDYSLVEYRTCKDKVKIICPIHGVFEQTPDHHINGQSGCPGCTPIKRRATVRARYGVDYVSQTPEFQARVAATNVRKYGGRSPWCSPEVRQKFIETSRAHWGTDYPMQNPDVVKKYRQAFAEKYGVDWPTLDTGICERIQATVFARYGVKNAMQNKAVREKAVKTIIARYGVDNPAHLADFAERCQKSSLTHWGVDHPMQVKDVRDKAFASRIEHGTASTSSCEDKMCEMLCNRFGQADVCRNYVSDQYPFHCDAYVKSLDLYIELNATWVHGGHWFDERCVDDLSKLSKWQSQALQGSMYYENAIHTWTVSDLLKRETAIVNGLNYLVFWDNNLEDFRMWFDTFDMNPVLKQF